MNIYEYGSANPAMHLDAFGLAWYDWIPGVSTGISQYLAHFVPNLTDPLGLSSSFGDGADGLIQNILDRLQSMDVDCACELAVSGFPYLIDLILLPDNLEGRPNWRWQHCMSNCLMVSQCGGDEEAVRCAARLSLIKELIDLAFCLAYDPDGENCRSAFQPGDFIDNGNGRIFGRECNQVCDNSPLGRWKCCHTMCTESGAAIGAPDPPPGPFYREVAR